MASNSEGEALTKAHKRGNSHTKLSEEREAFDKLLIDAMASIVGIDKRGEMLITADLLFSP